MSKLPVPDLRAGYRSVEQLQETLGNIQEEFDNTLSRDGTSPNAMQAPIDMNDNPIVNLGAPVNPTDAVRLVDITGLENVDITTWNSIIGKPTSFPPSSHSHVVADITDFNPGVEALVGSSIVAGTNVTVDYNPTTGKTTVSSSGGGGGGSTDWTDITNKPTTFTPSAHTQAFSTITDGQEAVEDIVANQIIGGTGITTSYNDSTGKLTINASGGGGGGPSGIIDFADVFSGVGDGITNNDAAFAAAEASSYEQIYLPQGRFYTTTAIDSFTKSYWGPGKIYRGTAGAGAYPNFSRYSTEVHPTVDPNWPYGIAEDTEFGEVEWKVINQGMRKNFDRYLQHPGNPDGFPPYFWAPSTPHFLRFQNKGGWSGFSGATSTAITAGVSTTVGVVGGTTGWNIGDEIGFTDAMDGNVLETKVLTSVGGGTIGWSGTLANNYPAGSTLIHGYRTMNSAYITIANASGGGDTYIHTARMTVDYDGLASQTAFQHRATGGLFGGELVLAKNGVYGTGWEGIYQDTGFDASCIGTVNSYVRTVDTGGYGNTWLHDYAKMDGGGSGFSTLGLKRIDGIYVAALGAKTGLDFTNSTFSLAAVALPIEAKIALDAQVVAPSGSNGNGFVATTDNNMYIRGSVVSGTKVIELNNGSYRLRLQANGGLTTNAQFTIGNSILASGTVTGNTLIANSGTVQLGSGGNTYFSFDGTTVRLYKNGSLVGSW